MALITGFWHDALIRTHLVCVVFPPKVLNLNPLIRKLPGISKLRNIL